MRASRCAALVPLPALTIALLAGTSASAADQGSKPAKQILADTARDLAKVRSFHVEGTEIDKDGRTRLSGDVLASGSLRLRATMGSMSFRLTVIGTATYLRANAAYWKAEGGATGKQLAASFANRWVRVPDSGGGGAADALKQLTPKGLAHCIGRGTGTVTNEGTRTLGSRRVVVLVDKGDKPGSSPGRLYVAASGRALPLRVTQTGPRKPGGQLDPRCEDAASTTKRSDVRLSAFDKPVKITAPKGAIDLRDMQGQAPATVSGVRPAASA
jgi:hypothetical protein